MREVIVDGENLDVETLVEVARNGAKIRISDSAMENVRKSRKVLERWVEEGRIIYGVTTGFGPMCDNIIPPKSAIDLQKNLIMSHSVGLGEFLPKEVVRAVMVIRLNTVVKGFSGIREETVNVLMDMLNKGVHPQIPEIGSVGASGDLAPLSHLVLVMMGKGIAEYQGEILDGETAMERAGIERVELSYKEGLALINGTSVMCGIAALLVHDAERIVRTAEISTALSLEALCGTSDAFDERGNSLKLHPGQIKTAKNMRKLIKGSKLIKSHKELIDSIEKERKRVFRTEKAIQDAYSLRCIPQIFGTVRDAVEYSKKVIEREINSASDNPLIFPEGDVFHGGNFHGQPIAFVCDMLAISLSEIGITSERRIARILDRKLNEGLPPFLIRGERGVQSGFMGIQYPATALVAENRILSHPASTESIPTNANNQDVVSMGTIAARKAKKILENVEKIIAIELLCAVQGIDIRGPEKLADGTKSAYEAIREEIPEVTMDRVMYPDIERAVKIIRSGKLLKTVEKTIGKLE
ncbi:MAG: histidine ammonia-lyase [Candidatus Syntropharchaeia archaeon]